MDPQAFDLEAYVQFAESKGMKITHVLETHVQADHLSGGRALAARTGAAYCLHEAADVAFDFTPLVDGQEIVGGNTLIRVLHTPGHTPESVCLLVTDRTRGPEPWFLLTGDTLFVGSVGRPDLPGEATESARQLYRSLRQKVLPLPDTVEVYPAHFSGSACGKGLSGKAASTLGFERKFNPFLTILSEEEFVRATTTGIPPHPEQMAATLAQNRGRR